ncbi:MAG: YIP1 family protein [Chlorobi bacterium]|nr:YIP1 family protein [Chlorobiota bacterium]
MTDDTSLNMQPPEMEPGPGDGGPTVEPMSISDQFVGVLSEPGAMFENIRQAGPRTSDWLVPLGVMILVLVVVRLVQMNNPDFSDQLLQIQRQTMEERFAQEIEAGKMTREQADKAMETAEKLMNMGSIFSIIGIIIFVPIVFFIMALIYWLLLKFGFKSDVSYKMVLSAYGPVNYIGAIEQILGLLMMFITGSALATFSLGVLVTPDLQSTTWKLLSSINPITIWSLVVLAIGFTRVAKISSTKAYGLVFALWLIWTVIKVFVGFGFGT